MPGICIIGTDTGVGKTIVTAGLCLLLRSWGVRVGVIKPVQSGHKRHDPLGDSARLKRLAQLDDSFDEITPYAYLAPVTPFLAAQMEGETIDPEQILHHIQMMEAKYDLLLIEGAGGLMVPMGKDWMLSDLLVKIGYPTLIVARPNLGTINHSVLTVEASRNLQLDPLGVILNGYKDNELDEDISIKSNASLIEKFANISVVGKIPWLASVNTETVLNALLHGMYIEKLVRMLQDKKLIPKNTPTVIR